MENFRKDILFLCQFFYPEYNSSATLPFDTAKYLASQGFSVDGLVGYPKEYSVNKHLPLEETVDGVGIKRIKYIQLNRTGMLGRLINYFSFTLHSLLQIRYLRNYKSVIVYSNPPVLPIVPTLAKKLYGTRFVFVAYDVYPEVAYASHSLTPDSIVSKVMDWINKRLYKSVDCVVALTDEMKEFLLANRPELSRERITTIANWAHESTRKPDHEAYERFGYKDGQFVVSYFGNMGTCQDTETMMKAAERLKNDDRVRFLIVGHGNKKGSVDSRIREGGLKNVQLLDFLTGKDFQQAVAISSCCIVSLEKGLMGTCAPSKYYSYLQGGQPVLAVTEKESYLAQEVEREKIGYAVTIGDGEALKDAIVALVENPEQELAMGKKARALYESRYSYETAMEKYRELFGTLLH
ncbi:MAG: glycosyltransferase family 4 protein [Candidatus Limivicinus sp.]|nr:glycosyltransferase family 4 protein [Candidatus Limivicinus sp.]